MTGFKKKERIRQELRECSDYKTETNMDGSDIPGFEECNVKRDKEN